MILNDMLFRRLVKRENREYLDYIHDGFFRGIVYGVDSVTGLYTFWKYTKGKLVLIENDITKDKARFKLLILMERGDELD